MIRPRFHLQTLCHVLSLMLGLMLAQCEGASTGPRPGSAASEGTTPRYQIHQDAAGWWWRASDGRKFLSLGVCVFDQGIPRQGYDAENPGYAAWQHYPVSEAWARDGVQRLKSWGFNTLGAWADLPPVLGLGAHGMLLTPVLHIGSTAGAPWWDMWDEGNIARMHRVARGQIELVRNEPGLLGYYSDNELGWWNATLWKMTLGQPASSRQRQKLVELLRRHYSGDWTRMRKDFDPEMAAGWSALKRGGTLLLRPGSAGVQVMRNFQGMLAERYYSLMREIIHTYDPKALYLGDRYQSFYYSEVARACARNADVVSCNLNPSWSDGTFVRCQLDTLHALTGKPILVTEIYMAATDNRSGNRNNHGVYPVVPSQSDRASSLKRTLNQLSRLPYVIGVDWFQYYDEPRHGRGDGENFNFGLVDINNQPYQEVVSAFSSIPFAGVRSQPSEPRLSAVHGIPRAPKAPLEQFTPTHALESWDRERGFVPAATPFPMADLYVCWSSNAVYLGLYAFDIVEEAYYRGGWLPKQDRALWTIRIKDSQPYHARLGGGREPIPSDANVRLEHLSGRSMNVRNIAAVELSASRLSRSGFRGGDVLELESSLRSHGGVQEMIWKGRFELRE